MKTIEAPKVIPQAEMIIQNDNTQFDVIIIGGGPAGLTAGIYAGRAKLKTLIIEKALLGGMASSSYQIDNFPGFPQGVSGMDLSQKIEEQARKLGVSIFYGDVTKVNKDRSVEIEGKKLHAKAIIIASGSEPKKLNIPGEKELRGLGVSYCATCDGPFYKEKSIAVIGGGNAAIEEAIYLTRFAKKVTVIHRRNSLRADKILGEHALNNEKIFIMWDSVVESIEGGKRVEAISIKNLHTKIRSKIPIDGVFIYVGTDPSSKFAAGLLKTTEEGYIKADADMKTSAPGIFACGDVIKKTLRQIVTACADGAVAANSARKFIEEGK